VKTLDDTLNNSIRTFALSLHAKPAPAMHQLTHHSIGKPRLNLVPQRLALHLERRNRNGLDPRRKLVLSHRLVAYCKTGNEEKHQDEEGNTDQGIHWCWIVSHTPQIFTD